MAFDWKEYLALARSLENQAGNGFTVEATTRCAVSRAYYSAFCYARNYAQKKLGYVIRRDGQDHKEVREHFIKRRMNTIATKLETLHRWRTNCDYDEILPAEANLLKLTFMHAQYVLEKLN